MGAATVETCALCGGMLPPAGWAEAPDAARARGALARSEFPWRTGTRGTCAKCEGWLWDEELAREERRLAEKVSP